METTTIDSEMNVYCVWCLENGSCEKFSKKLDGSYCCCCCKENWKIPHVEVGHKCLVCCQICMHVRVFHSWFPPSSGETLTKCAHCSEYVIFFYENIIFSSLEALHNYDIHASDSFSCQ